MRLPFTKMEALGNDFVLMEWPEGVPVPAAERIRRLGDRRRGIGFDQLLLIGRRPGVAATYRVFNADGGEAEQSGNGVRCLARHLAPPGGGEVLLAGAAGLITAQVDDEGLVTVDLGVPDFRPASLPFAAEEERERYRLRVASGEVELGAVSMGNPHAVIEVDSVERAPVGILAPELQAHAAFPKGVNVGFMERVTPSRIRLRVFERGAGETLACGSGAAAAVAVGRRWGLLEPEVDVALPGGSLTVRWPGPGAPLRQTGPATTVYEGRIEL